MSDARVFLVRHGQTDWASMDARGLRGAVNDLAALTSRGSQDAHRAAEQLRDRLGTQSVSRLVSSPMTRALQTAAIIAAELAAELTAEIDVDFDLREWLVDDTYQWDAATAPRVLAEFDALGGEWPPGERRAWEPLSAVRQRAAAALDRVPPTDGGVTVAVCHGVVIRALTGLADVPTGAIVAYG